MPARSASTTTALKRIIDDAYKAAGLDPANIDTGAVILTGEALRRENAEGIAKLLSEQGGDFVCATAGHHMESMLAAYGSGASKASHEGGKRILNIDIGGGTTKLAIVEKGFVTATAAVHIGGRLQVVDEKGNIVRLDPAGRYHARQAGFDWHKGDVIDPKLLDSVAETMADELVAALTQRPMPHAVEHLYLTDRDPRLRQDRRHDVLRRRRRIRLRPRDPRLRRHGPPARARDPRAASTPASSRGRCCRRPNASAPPRSARRNTASSSPATPATSPSRASCCRGGTCRWSSRRSNAKR